MTTTSVPPQGNGYQLMNHQNISPLHSKDATEGPISATVTLNPSHRHLTVPKQPTKTSQICTTYTPNITRPNSLGLKYLT